MRHWIRPALSVAVLFIATALWAGIDEARAQAAPERVFAGKVLASDKRFPTRADSERAFVKKIRERARDRIREDEDNERWRIYFASFFDRPLNDLEVTIRLYDVTSGEKQFITSFQQFVQRRGLRSLISQVTLDRPRFDPNRRILMVMENRGRVYAQGAFYIVGKVDQGSGDVDFTDD